MIILSHPTGNENVRNAALALARAGLLAEFDTCISWDKKSRLNNFIPHSMRRLLFRRSLPPEVFALTRTFPLRETARLIASQFKLNFLTTRENAPLSIDSVYRSLDLKTAKRLDSISGIKAAYAYEDCALETFKRAHALGLKCIYELPIGYFRPAQEIYREEAERNPEWAPTLKGLSDSERKLARKDEELRLADTIIVASSFAKDTLKKAPEIKAGIKVIPLGGPAPRVSQTTKSSAREKLKVIYVGALTQRKGISYLFEAAAKLGTQKIDLTLVGRKPLVKCAALSKALSACNWIPSLPHQEILDLMRQNDCLVLPSLFEGFGLVIVEAMSQGLPVITTPNTCGPDIIHDGADGFIVPIRSSEAIADKLELLYNKRDLLISMGQEAAKKAASCNWEQYHRNIIEAVR
ncbi:MAG: glycosyltransferase family 4 protein [Candidatus Omnitrophota bacterium]